MLLGRQSPTRCLRLRVKRNMRNIRPRRDDFGVKYEPLNVTDSTLALQFLQIHVLRTPHEADARHNAVETRCGDPGNSVPCGRLLDPRHRKAHGPESKHDHAAAGRRWRTLCAFDGWPDAEPALQVFAD